VQKVSAERVRDEIMKLMEAEKPSVGLEKMRESGLLDLFLPELSAAFNIPQNRFHKYDIYYHSILSCDAAPQDRPIIRLAALLHDIGKVPTRRPGPNGDSTFYNHEVLGAKMTRKIMKRLKFSNEQIERVNNLIINHMFHYTDEWTDGAVRRFIRKVGLDSINDLIALRLADRKGNGARSGIPAPIETLMEKIEKVIEADNAFSVRDLDIDGNILMDAFNLQPGPVIGTVLNELLEIVLDNPELNKKETLIRMAGEILEKHAVKS
jgi:poly(A) polymerase/tRNA nucleotidyltransferase (CCA-adding enzyme)